MYVRMYFFLPTQVIKNRMAIVSEKHFDSGKNKISIKSKVFDFTTM